MITSMDHPTAGTIHLTGFPFLLSETPCGPETPPPTLGEHTDEILTDDLGLSKDEINELRQRGAIG